MVEVLAALALIAGTMTALLLAQSRSVQQLAATKHSAEAHALAEALILRWKVNPAAPLENEGAFEDSRFRWTREAVPSTLSSSRELLEIRFRVYGRNEGGDEQMWAEYVWLEAPLEKKRDAKP
ncbi:MAG: hypothetical protein IT449_07395 [Phycisphaerales bacterium]|nr:hypothetical protein [Phycisphaerales bacterium]